MVQLSVRGGLMNDSASGLAGGLAGMSHHYDQVNNIVANGSQG